MNQPLDNLRRFCSYRERCTADVEAKLHQLGIARVKWPQIIETLRNENFLNEGRFAGAFSRGKFRINRWGRIRIRYELSARGIPEEMILKGLQEIDEAEYEKAVRDLVRKKFSEIKVDKKLNIRNKIFTFVSGKGFESDLVFEAINELKI